MRIGGLLLAALFAAGLPGLAAAEEPKGCDAFKWPVQRERVALVASNKPEIVNGGALSYDVAATVHLAPLAEAGLPHAPERAPKPDRPFAGHFTLAAPAEPGVYKLTISAEAWIDLIDNGVFLHPKGFSGASDCAGVRKSMKFDLPARPLDIQLSGVKDAEIGVMVSPGE